MLKYAREVIDYLKAGWIPWEKCLKSFTKHLNAITNPALCQFLSYDHLNNSDFFVAAVGGGVVVVAVVYSSYCKPIIITLLLKTTNLQFIPLCIFFAQFCYFFNKSNS